MELIEAIKIRHSVRNFTDEPVAQEIIDGLKSLAEQYKPERSWNYEVGTHLNLFNNLLHVNLATFYMQVRNQQISVMAGNYGFGRMMTNAGKSHSAGMEMTVRGAALSNKLNYQLTYSFTSAERRCGGRLYHI